MEELISKRYAQALLSVANEEERVVYIGLLNQIADAFDNPRVQAIMQAPIVSNEKKAETILSVLDQRADKKFINFIKILSSKKRLPLIPVIANLLNAQVQKEKNEYEGVVLSQNKLGSDELVQLEETLKSYTGATIKLSQAESNLDGLMVEVEDLGIEVNFSKERVKEQLIDFIMKSH